MKFKQDLFQRAAALKEFLKEGDGAAYKTLVEEVVSSRSSPLSEGCSSEYDPDRQIPKLLPYIHRLTATRSERHLSAKPLPFAQILGSQRSGDTALLESSALVRADSMGRQQWPPYSTGQL